MKKILFSLMLVVGLLALGSCGGDDESRSSLKGTSWSAATANPDEILVIEFTSDSEVAGYLAAQNGSPTGSVRKGSYSFDGSRIVFSDFTVVYVSIKEHFTGGSVSGNLMTLSSWWEMGGNKYEDSKTFRKR